MNAFTKRIVRASLFMLIFLSLALLRSGLGSEQAVHAQESRLDMEMMSRSLLPPAEPFNVLPQADNNEEDTTYVEPLYGYELSLAGKWHISPTPADALYGAALFYNYDPDIVEATGNLPSDALKIQIGVAPLPDGQDFQNWVTKWADFEINGERVEEVEEPNLTATYPDPIKIGAFDGVKYTINGPNHTIDDSNPAAVSEGYFPSVLEINLQLSAKQIMVIGVSSADSPALSQVMDTLVVRNVDSTHVFPVEVMQLAEQWAKAPLSSSPFSDKLPESSTDFTCPGGTFPGTEAPNSPLTLYMPFTSGETWTVGGAGAFYGNLYHCNYYNDYYATDWNRSGDNGAAVLPVANGTISGSQPPICPNTGYGCYVRIDHASNIRTLYAHLGSVNRTSGSVSHSEQIGTVV
jgi:hypothetical protein